MRLSEMNPHETKFIPVVGDPVSHMTSVFLYNRIFDEYHINAMTYPCRVKKGELPQFLAAARFMNTPGCIFSSPHKADLVSLVDEVDDISRAFASVNCVKFRDDGTTEGHGLDGKGVIGGFDSFGVDLKGKKVVQIGAGGIGGIFANELVDRGIGKLTILNRTVEKAQKIAQTLEELKGFKTNFAAYTPENAHEAVKDADIVINATTLGMKSNPEDHPDLTFLEDMPAGGYVMEAVSNPPETPFVKKGKSLGQTAVLGMDMQVAQVKAICKFLLGWDAPEEAVKVGLDFFCERFDYQR